MTDDLTLLHALAAVAIMAAGSAFQAAVGIGMALLVVPLLVLIDDSFIPGPMLLAGTILAATTAYRERQFIDTPNLLLSVAGLVVGTLLGAMALAAVSGPGVAKVFGALVLVAVAISVLVPAIEQNRVTIPLAGGAAGLMGTMVGIHGPPISLVFQNSEPAVARAMLGAFFAVAYAGSVATLVLFGLFGWPQLLRAGILVPGVLLGLVLAPLIRNHINRTRLRFAILAISMISAVTLLLR